MQVFSESCIFERKQITCRWLVPYLYCNTYFGRFQHFFIIFIEKMIKKENSVTSGVTPGPRQPAGWHEKGVLRKGPVTRRDTARRSRDFLRGTLVNQNTGFLRILKRKGTNQRWFVPFLIVLLLSFAL